MIDLHIHRLTLTLEEAGGATHRVRPIVERASRLAAQRLEERLGATPEGIESQQIDSLSAPAVSLALDRISNEQAASALADALAEAIARKLLWLR